MFRVLGSGYSFRQGSDDLPMTSSEGLVGNTAAHIKMEQPHHTLKDIVSEPYPNEV